MIASDIFNSYPADNYQQAHDGKEAGASNLKTSNGSNFLHLDGHVSSAPIFAENDAF